jgi:hypothetical protein
MLVSHHPEQLCLFGAFLWHVCHFLVATALSALWH